MLYPPIRIDTDQFGYVRKQQGNQKACDPLAAADIVDNEAMLVLRDEGEHAAAAVAAAIAAAVAVPAAVAALFDAWCTKLVVVRSTSRGVFTSQGLL